MSVSAQLAAPPRFTKDPELQFGFLVLFFFLAIPDGFC